MEKDNIPMIDLSTLNPQQRQAVTTIQGPVLILAGPGAGKTRVLTYRIAYLIEKGVNPEHILAVTFTNRAAREMRERISNLQLTTYNLQLLTIGTFHSVCARILRKEGRMLDIQSNFTIYDRSDQLLLLKGVWQRLGIASPSLTPNYALGLISKAKSELIPPQEYAKTAQSSWEHLFGQVYIHYQEELLRAGALDFDDLIMKTVELLKNEENVSEKWQERFRYILIDEFQDVNIAQGEFVRLLAKKYRNISVVGDEGQSIYRFRSADFRTILNFKEDWPDAVIVKLEQNYRSTKTIVAAAQHLIMHNRLRTEKELWTRNRRGRLISLIELENEDAEAAFVINNIVQTKLPLLDTAILFRVNAQSRPLEEALIKQGVPYRTIGLTRFYERKEVKDILAYLRIFENPADTVSMGRIMNVPPRGLPEKSFKTIAPYQKELLVRGQIPEELKAKLAERTIKHISQLLSLYRALKEAQKTKCLNAFIEFLIERTGYDEVIARSKDPEERKEILRELIGIASEFPGNADTSLGKFLEQVALYANESYERGRGVTLLTAHAAKGLEFLAVYLTGLEYGVFPHYKSISKPEELEEERRLCYVAITRAKERLVLTYTRRRKLYGRVQANPPSNFLEEIPAELTVRERHG